MLLIFPHLTYFMEQGVLKGPFMLLQTNHEILTPPMFEVLSKRQETSVSEDVERKEPLYAADGNINWYSHCGKELCNALKKKKRM